jgi:hypothetical protein
LPAIEIAVRVLLILVSAGVSLSGSVNVWISGVVSLLGIAATVELMVRPYADYMVARVLLACGALATTLILVGLLLNVTPWGLTRTSWAITWLSFSFCVLWLRRRSRTNWNRPVIKMNFLIFSIIVAALILIGSVLVALAGVRDASRKPLLSFSLVSVTPKNVVVEISATSLSGRYSIITMQSNSTVPRYSSMQFSVKAGSKGLTVKESVPIPTAGRWVVNLQDESDRRVVRELIVDVGL